MKSGEHVAGTVPANGINLAYEAIGDPAGAPTLLVAGVGAQLINWPLEVCDAMASRGRYVIRFDNRDVGLSTKFPAGGYGLCDLAEDAVGLIRSLQLGPTHVVGQSLGGMIAQEIAIREPEQVRSLTLLSTTPSLAYFEGEGLAVMIGSGEPPPNRASAVEQFVARESFFTGPDYSNDEDVVRRLAGEMWDRDSDTAAGGRQMVALAGGPDRIEALAELRCPTIVIHGSNDRLISPSAAEGLAQLIPNAELHVIPRMGHQVPSVLWPEIVRLIVGA